MTAQPLTNAIALLRDAIHDTLAPLMLSATPPVGLSYRDSANNAKLYWQQATQGVSLPYIVYQSQDGGGRAERQIGAFGWSGLVTVRSLAKTYQGHADALAAVVVPGMSNLIAPSGYTITASYERPLVLPPSDDGTRHAGHIWRVSLYRL